MIRREKVDIHQGYTFRYLGATAGALLLFIALFKWWPNLPIRERGVDLYDARGERVVTLEMIEPT